MSWKGDLLKAGISSDGKVVETFLGELFTKFGVGCKADDSNAEGLKILAHQVTLADNGTYNLPAAKNGFALVTSGAEGGIASVLDDGSVTILAGSTNFVGTESDTDLCIYDGGTYAIIKNMLGSSQDIFFVFVYF